MLVRSQGLDGMVGKKERGEGGGVSSSQAHFPIRTSNSLSSDAVTMRATVPTEPSQTQRAMIGASGTGVATLSPVVIKAREPGPGWSYRAWPSSRGYSGGAEPHRPLATLAPPNEIRLLVLGERGSVEPKTVRNSHFLRALRGWGEWNMTGPGARGEELRSVMFD